MIKTTKTVSYLFVLLFLISFSIEAQLNNYQKGTVILNNNKTLEVYIDIDFRTPQNFQSSISCITLKNYDKYQLSGKLKRKRKVAIKAKDIIGFDLENGKSFRTVTYFDHGNIGMKPLKLCLEQRVAGKINVYKLYSHTEGEMSNQLSEVIQNTAKEGDEGLIHHLKNNFQLLVQKGAASPKNLMTVPLLNYIGDNSRVKENYTQNHYGFRDGYKDDGKNIINTSLETSFLKLVQDYEVDRSATLAK